MFSLIIKLNLLEDLRYLSYLCSILPDPVESKLLLATGIW